MSWFTNALVHMLFPLAIVVLVVVLTTYYRRRNLAYARETLDAFLVISHLLAKPGQNVVEIQGALGLSFAKLPRMVRRLERLGILEATLQPTAASNYKVKVPHYRVANRILARDLKAFAKEYETRSHHER